MFDLQKATVDASAMQDGVWLDHPRWKGCAFKIASSETAAYKNASEEAKQLVAAEAQASGEKISEDRLNEVLAGITSKALLRDWRGDIMDGKKRIPFSQENAARVLTLVPDLRKWIEAQADNIEHFRKARLEELAKNSEKASPGPSSTDQE